MKNQLLNLGPLEMKVVGLLEGNTSFSVLEIQQQLEAQGKSLAYTTVMTILGRLFDKGVVRRERVGRQFYYSIGNRGDQLKTGVFASIYRSLFNNDRLKPILSLLSDKEHLSNDELKVLRDLIDDQLKIRGNSV